MGVPRWCRVPWEVRLSPRSLGEADAGKARGDRHGGPIRKYLTELAFSWKAA